MRWLWGYIGKMENKMEIANNAESIGKEDGK